jgi:hypothetical protein
MYFRFLNSTTSITTDFEGAFPVQTNAYLAPGDSGTLRVGARSNPVTVTVPPVPVLTPGTWTAGQIRFIDRPSILGNQGTLQVFAAPLANGGPLTTLTYRLNTGSGFLSPVTIPWAGVTDYTITVPGTTPITVTGVEAWVNNAFGAGAVFTVFSGSLSLTVASSIIDRPISSQFEYDLRETLRATHMVADAAVQNENTFTGFSSVEKAAMTAHTATSLDQVFSIINTMTNSSQFAIACDWDGISLATVGSNGVTETLDFSGNTVKQHAVLPATGLTDAAVDGGKARPAHAVYLYAAPGKSPTIETFQFRGYSKVELNGLTLGNTGFARGTSNPLTAMVAIKSCVIGYASLQRIQSVGARVMHIEDCDVPFGCVADRPAQYNRYWDNRITEGRGTIDTFNFLRHIDTIYDNWILHFWAAGNLYYKVQQQDRPGSTSHFDFWQFGNGADVNNGYRLLFEFNVTCIDTRALANNCQGFFMGDANRGVGALYHNNVLIFTGQKGIDHKDWSDNNDCALYRNMVLSSGQGYSVTGNLDQTLENPCKIYIDSAVTPKVNGGIKRVTENYAATFGIEGGNPANLVDRNIQIRFKTAAGEASHAPNRIKGNGTWSVVNGGYRYTAPDLNLTGAAECRAAILDFCEPLVGWRGVNVGPIHPDEWVTDYAAAFTAPAAPQMRVAPTFPTPTRAEESIVATFGQWANPEIITREWQVSDDDVSWTTYTTSQILFISSALIGRYVRRREYCTNMTGATEWLSSSYGPILTDNLGGTIFTEDWTRGGTAASAGSFNTQLGSGGTLGAPLYTRVGGTNMVGTFVTDAAAPSGVAARFGTTSNIFGQFYRDDIATAMAGAWTTCDITVRHKTRAVTQNQAAFGFPHVSSTTVSSTRVTGIGFARATGATNQLRNLNSRAIWNAGTLVGSTYADGVVVYYRLNITKNGDGTVTSRLKSWLPTEPEPAWQVTETRTYTISDMVYAGVLVLNKTDAIEVQSYSVRVI